MTNKAEIRARIAEVYSDAPEHPTSQAERDIKNLLTLLDERDKELDEWRELLSHPSVIHYNKLRAELEAAQTQLQAARAALLSIKSLVCGDKIPNWKDQWATTQTRGRIADIVDSCGLSDALEDGDA